MNEVKIVTRHEGAKDFLRSKGYEGRVIEQFSPEMAEKGDLVIGVLPVQLIDEVLRRGARFISIIMPDVPEDMRGKELSPSQMEEFGARLVEIEDIFMRWL